MSMQCVECVLPSSMCKIVRLKTGCLIHIMILAALIFSGFQISYYSDVKYILLIQWLSNIPWSTTTETLNDYHLESVETCGVMSVTTFEHSK